MGHVNTARHGLYDLDGHNHIKAQKRKVRAVFLAERLAFQMGMDEAQTVEIAGSWFIAAKIRQGDAPCIADQRPENVSATVNQYCDLAVDLGGDFADMAGQFGADDIRRRNAPSEGVLQSFNLARLQSFNVSNR
jgi:hypothetical protein